jgi:flagellin
MRINQNIMAFNAYRNLTSTEGMLGKSLEKLSSGYRINRAADDASGLVISQGLRAQVSGLKQATRNAQDGVSVVQTAEGALTEVHSMLNRMRDLIVQSANTASNDSNARQAAQNEIVQLRAEIDRIGQTTSFGSQLLLNGSFGAQVAKLSYTNAVGTTGVVVNSASFSLVLVVDSAATGLTSYSIDVTLTTGTYATAASWESQLQSAISGALSTAIGTVTAYFTVNVKDLGGGAWQTQITRNSSATGSKLTIAGVGTGQTVITSTSAILSNQSGGVFQVGANVTTTNQINVSISDIRITSGTDANFTALSGIDVTDTTSHTTAQVLIDDAIADVSDLRGRLGAAQNRFESTISNLQVTTENLSASESRIRDTDMASEMVTFTRNQILLQAGTAMLAQANAAPQTVLRLLQG